jgi:hypothetical protein
LEAVKAKIPEAYRNQVKPEDLLNFLNTGENIITIDS